MTPSQESQHCVSCRSTKPTSPCGVCEEGVCKRCVQRTNEETFRYLPELPDILQRPQYCSRCWDENVAAPLAEYEDTLEKAKAVSVLPKSYRATIPIQKKATREIRVEDCPDRDEAILKMAFLAASEGYNALIKAEVNAQKVRNHGYQKSSWSGSAIPAVIDTRKLEDAELREEMWRIGH